jgi:hypothetical protein
VDPCPEQRLVRVDVADARDPALVKDERLDRCRAPTRDRPQVIGGELRGHWLDPEASVQVLVPGGGAVDHVAGTEPPRVDVDEPMAVVELDPDPRVDRLDVGVEQERAGHPQVRQQKRLVLELPDEVLAAAPDVRDPLPTQLIGDLGRRDRAGPAGVEDLDPLKRAPLQMGRELAADRLDFGQFGHRPYL